MILISQASAPIKGKIESNEQSKAKREASRNEFVEKGDMPDRCKRFRKIKSSEDRPRAPPEFVNQLSE